MPDYFICIVTLSFHLVYLLENSTQANKWSSIKEHPTTRHLSVIQASLCVHNGIKTHNFPLITQKTQAKHQAKYIEHLLMCNFTHKHLFSPWAFCDVSSIAIFSTNRIAGFTPTWGFTLLRSDAPASRVDAWGICGQLLGIFIWLSIYCTHLVIFHNLAVLPILMCAC